MRLGRKLWQLVALLASVSLMLGMLQPAKALDLGRILLNGLQVIQLSQLSDRQEVNLGRQIDQQLRSSGQVRVSRDPGQVAQIGQRLAQISARPNLPFTFQVVEDQELNAFATVGGFVYITSGALGVMDNESQLAAVLAHEIGHITERHALRQLQQAATARAGAQILGLESSNLANAALDLGLLRPQSRENEFIADERGLELLYRSGYDPRGLVEFLTKLLNQPRSPQFLSTHPATSERIIRLNQLIAANRFGPSNPSFEFNNTNQPQIPVMPRGGELQQLN